MGKKARRKKKEKQRKKRKQANCVWVLETLANKVGSESLGPQSPMKEDAADEMASLGLVEKKVSAPVRQQKQQDDHAGITI